MKKKEFIEILGILAIIGSLIFVGIEIRQNSLEIRASTHQSVSEQVTKLYLHIAGDERLSKLVSGMMANDEFRNELNATKELFTGDKTLYVHASYAKDIRESVRYFTEIGIKKVVIVGGQDALNAIKILKEKNIPIILKRVHSLPSNEDAGIDQFYTLPAKLQEKGIFQR